MLEIRKPEHIPSEGYTFMAGKDRVPRVRRKDNSCGGYRQHAGQIANNKQVLRLTNRQLDSERRPLAQLTLDADAAAVGLDQLAGDSQSKSAPCATGTGARPVASPEAVKDIGQILARNTLTRVLHSDTDAALGRFRPERDGPAWWCVAQRVGRQISQHLI